jgi:multicomponent Na+:H+ antiporter subunit G
MSALVAMMLVLLGAGFMLLSAVGVLRMPDVYMRLQVASKASSLGAGLLMFGVAVHFDDLGVLVRALLVVAFIFLTTPVSAHLIGRAAYMTGVPLWEGSILDELRGAYDARRGTLQSPGQRRAADDDEASEAGHVEQAPPGRGGVDPTDPRRRPAGDGHEHGREDG